MFCSLKLYASIGQLFDANALILGHNVAYPGTSVINVLTDVVVDNETGWHNRVRNEKSLTTPRVVFGRRGKNPGDHRRTVQPTENGNIISLRPAAENARK